MVSVEALEKRILDFLQTLFELDEDAPELKDVDVNADLTEEIGFDSLEAFETVIALHEFLDVEMPDDIEIESVSTIHNIAEYIIGNYDETTIDEFMNRDLSELAMMRQDDESIEI